MPTGAGAGRLLAARFPGGQTPGVPMLLQLTAYTVMDRLVVQLTRADVTEHGRQWSHMILEDVDIADLDPDEPWDLAWAVNEVLTRAVVARIERERSRPGSL